MRKNKQFCSQEEGHGNLKINMYFVGKKSIYIHNKYLGENMQKLYFYH